MLWDLVSTDQFYEDLLHCIMCRRTLSMYILNCKRGISKLINYEQGLCFINVHERNYDQNNPEI